MNIIKTKDYEQIAKLSKYVHELHVEKYPDLFKPFDYEIFRDYFKKYVSYSDSIFLLVEENNEYIGYAWLIVQEAEDTNFTTSEASLYVQQMSINPENTHKGYGAKLMDEFCEIGKQLGIKRIELEYWSDNSIAKEFYEKQGFKPQREFVYKNI